MKHLQLLFITLLFIIHNFQAQEDYVNENVMHYSDWNYKSNIQTVKLHESSFDANPAILELNGNTFLELSFDDLDFDKKSYSISFEHCNANWEPSNLMATEFINGFFEANILNYTYSTNTIQKYTHYAIMFPQANINFTKSGNYIVYVYQDNDKEKLILTKRCMIFVNKEIGKSD